MTEEVDSEALVTKTNKVKKGKRVKSGKGRGRGRRVENDEEDKTGGEEREETRKTENEIMRKGLV